MEIDEFFALHPKTAIAFSGGVDSSYLLYTAKKYGAEVQAYYVQSAFQPQFELDDAVRLAKEVGIPMKILPVDVLSSETVTDNPANRCYHCKRVIFGTILKAAEEDGFPVILDGTNASDDVNDRPGMKALQELQVLSPLRECGITKDEVRRRSKEAGLFTWDKPAYACLATRIPTGEKITAEKLQATEKAENYLFSLGFTNFRIRRFADAARIQVPADQIGKLIENRENILQTLKKDYTAVLLDLEVRK